MIMITFSTSHVNQVNLSQVNLRQSCILKKLFDLMNYCWCCPIRLKAIYQYFHRNNDKKLTLFFRQIKSVWQNRSQFWSCTVSLIWVQHIRICGASEDMCITHSLILGSSMNVLELFFEYACCKLARYSTICIRACSMISRFVFSTK